MVTIVSLDRPRRTIDRTGDKRHGFDVNNDKSPGGVARYLPRPPCANTLDPDAGDRRTILRHSCSSRRQVQRPARLTPSTTSGATPSSDPPPAAKGAPTTYRFDQASAGTGGRFSAGDAKSCGPRRSRRSDVDETGHFGGAVERSNTSGRAPRWYTRPTAQIHAGTDATWSSAPARSRATNFFEKLASVVGWWAVGSASVG